MPKPKKPVRTKEEIIADEQRKAEVARKRDIITGQFYPALVKATISVDEAKALISATNSLLMGEVMKAMKEKKFSEVLDSIHKGLCQDGERSEEIKALLEVFKDENLFITRELIEGMTGAIERMIVMDNRNKTLDSFKPDWALFLN